MSNQNQSQPSLAEAVLTAWPSGATPPLVESVPGQPAAATIATGVLAPRARPAGIPIPGGLTIQSRKPSSGALGRGRCKPVSETAVRQMVVSPELGSGDDVPVTMNVGVLLDFLRQARAVHLQGLKSYGVFVAGIKDSAFAPTGVKFFDPARNRRNTDQNLPAFEAQGKYFREHDDAGFVVDNRDMAKADRSIGQAGQSIVAPFHSHRRQPPNFSDIDYRLHNPFFPWHLVICLRDPAKPEVQPFLIEKGLDDFGIDAADNREGCENSYEGDNVRPLSLIVEGSGAELDGAAHALGL